MGILANENAISSGGYQIPNSLRFQSASTQYLSRTPAVTGNRQTWTLSVWVKRGTLGSQNTIYGANSSDIAFMGFYGDNTFYYDVQPNFGTRYRRTTAAVFRDPSAWYHIVFVADTTNATNTERLRVYINNVQYAFSTDSTGTGYVPQNTQLNWNENTANRLGANVSGASYFDGYMTEINFIDGQALTPSSFGETNALTGQWVAKKYTGTYGTNGFYLPFSNGTSTTTLGNDSSGNGNNWTLNNFTRSANVSDCWMYDVPSGNGGASGTQPNSNYAVINPLWSGRTNSPTNGNLTYAASSVGIATIDVSGNSFYWEITSAGGTTTAAVYSTTASSSISVTTGLTYGFRFNGATGAFDYTTNGSSFTSIATGLTSGPYFPYLSTAAGTTANFNAGQRSFAYTPPSGFKALCTANLPLATIVKGNQYMDATLYTGNLIGQAITNAASFKPDLVWIKSRSAATDNKLTDSNRGAQKALVSNSNAAETTDLTGVVSFDTGGFTLGTSTTYNNTGATYVGWQWQAGQGTNTSNTSGSITSTTSVSTTAGFSVVTYTGTGANATVGHGLGVAPKMMLFKKRSGVQSWSAYHASLANTQFLFLDSTAAATTLATMWNSTSPTSSVFSIGTDGNVNSSAATYVAYCFAEIAGFSKFGSYTGNGSADGPFVYTGFRPKYVMIKRTDSTANWIVEDTARSPYNQTAAALYPNLSNAEDTSYPIDIVSNGFKIRNNSTAPGFNASGGTYIFACFAENPLAQSNAR